MPQVALGILSLVTILLCVYLTRLDRSNGRGVSIVVANSNRKVRVLVLRSFVNRFVGLLNHVELAADSAILLLSSKRVHTYGMAFPIDVVFLSKELRVLSIATNVLPGRKVAARHPETRHILETRASCAADLFTVGQRLTLLTEGSSCLSS